MNCRENPYYICLMPNPPGVGTLLVFGWCNGGSWLAQTCLICYYGRRLMLGQRYSKRKLASATVAVEPTLNHRLVLFGEC